LVLLPSCKRIATVLRSGEKRHDDFSDAGAASGIRRARPCSTPCKTTFGHAIAATLHARAPGDDELVATARPSEQRTKSDWSCAFARVPPHGTRLRGCSSSC